MSIKNNNFNEQKKKNEIIESNENVMDELNYIKNKINNDSKSLKNIEVKKDWKIFEEETYHFKQDIERVWMIVKNFDLLLLINNKGHYPCVITKGSNTNKIGNEFQGNFFGLLPFLAKVVKCINLPEMKKISWLFNSKSEQFVVKITLFKVTDDGTTALFWKSKFSTDKLKDLINQKTLFRKNDLFITIDKMLENEPINLFQHESGIINGKFEDIWEIVLDFNKINAIAPNNNCLAPINLKDAKQGDKLIVPFYVDGNKGNFDLKVDVKDERPGWNKWIVVYTVSGGVPKKIPKLSVVFQLTKINETDNQLAISTKFHEATSTKLFKELSFRKRYLLSSMKDYFDNFYSPSTNNEQDKKI